MPKRLVRLSAFILLAGCCSLAGAQDIRSSHPLHPSKNKNAIELLHEIGQSLPPDDEETRVQLTEIEKKSSLAPKDKQSEVIAQELPAVIAGRIQYRKRRGSRNAASQAAENRVDNALSDLANQAGDSRDAVLLSDDILSREPDNQDALNNRAAAHLSLGDYQPAIKDATRNNKNHPDDETALTIRALARFSSGDYLQAIEDSRHVLALNPYNETALYTLKLAQNRVPTAKLQLNEQQQAQAEEVKREYESMLQQQNQAEVVGHAANDALSAKTAEKIQEGKSSEAVEAASKALAADPHNVRAYVLRATAYTLLGQCRLAAEDATVAITLYPKDAAAYDARAAAFNQCGQYHDALADSFVAIALNPQDAYAYANRARTFEKLSHFKAMIADYQTAAALNAQFEPAYRDAVASYQRMPPAKNVSKPNPEPPTFEPRSEPRQSRQVLITLFSTLIGGTLIALGLLHILSMRPRPKRSIAAMASSDLEAEVDGSSSPLLFNNYQVLRSQGEGGMGIVYEAVDKALNRKVAIKKMRDEIRLDPKEREHFLREARTVAALHHPCIVEIYTILESDNDLFLIFEYVAGQTLTEILARKKRLPLAEAKEILRGTCAALEYAHKHGVVHRDLKPSNIMVSGEGDVKVMDFGIARQAREVLTRACVTNTVVGTPQYMAPEAEHGIVRKESDLYALGVCLYEMVTGERPFGNNSTITAKIAEDYQKPSQILSGISPAIDAIIRDALQPDPERRIRSARELFERFERAV